MNFAVLFHTLLLLGLTQQQSASGEENDLTSGVLSEEDQQKDEREIKDQSTEIQSEEDLKKEECEINVHRNLVTNTYENLAQQYIPALEKIIIDNCKANEQNEVTDNLQPTFDLMKSCIAEKAIFYTPKEEFLEHIKECSKEAIKLSKNCLADKYCYLPDFILNLIKSITRFLYDDFDIIRLDFLPCSPKLNDDKVLKKYNQCLKKYTPENPDPISATKEDLCRQVIPSAYCFTDMVRETCDKTPGLERYIEGYIKSYEEPCKEKSNLIV